MLNGELSGTDKSFFFLNQNKPIENYIENLRLLKENESFEYTTKYQTKSESYSLCILFHLLTDINDLENVMVGGKGEGPNVELDVFFKEVLG